MMEPRKAWIFLAASILSPSGMGEVVTETVVSCQLADKTCSQPGYEADIGVIRLGCANPTPKSRASGFRAHPRSG
jgi:hypothetical protein